MRRRKVRYHDEDDVPKPSPSFPWGNIVIAGVVPLATAVIVVTAQWAVTGDTTRKNEMQIQEDRKAREGMRDSFMASQKQLIDVLGKIDTRLAVAEKQTDSLTKQSDRLNESLMKTNDKLNDIIMRRLPPEGAR